MDDARPCPSGGRCTPTKKGLPPSGRPFVGTTVWGFAHRYPYSLRLGCPSLGTQSKGRFRSAVITARETEKGMPHDWTRRPAPADPSGPLRSPCQATAVRAPRQPCMVVGPWRKGSSVPGRVDWEKTIRQTLPVNSPGRRLRSSPPTSGPLIIARSPPCLKKRSRPPPRNAHRQGWPGYRRC